MLGTKILFLFFHDIQNAEKSLNLGKIDKRHGEIRIQSLN